MQVLELEQNTPEWETFRRTHIGASDSPIICGVSPYKSAYTLWKEKAVGEISTPTSAMMEGHRLEASVRQLAQEHFDMEFAPLCVLHDSINYLMASLDGYNKEKERVLEIKTVGNNTYAKVLKEGPLRAWRYQINHQMECTQTEAAYLFVLNRDSSEYEYYFIPRDQEIINEILEKDAEFYARLVNFEPPEDSHEERHDDLWRNAAESFLKAKEASVQAEEYLKTCKQHLIDISGSTSCRGHGVSTTKYFSRGTVDYSKIPEIKGVDLNQYRKPAREIWRIS